MANTVLNLQNYLSPSRACLVIPGLDNLSLTATAWNLPGVSTGAPLQPTPFTDMPHTGDKMMTDTFRIEFIVLEDISNWLEMYKWIVAVTDPRRTTAWGNKSPTYLQGDLVIYSSHNNPIITATFNNMVPISVSEIEFVTTDMETSYVKATAEFQYSDFIITLPDGSKLI